MRDRELFQPLANTPVVSQSPSTSPSDERDSTPPASFRRQWMRVIIPLLILAGLLVVGRSAADAIPAFAGWIDRLGIWGPIVFVVGYAVACVALVPASILTLAAGALFGLGLGIVLVLAGATLGATASFLLGRYVARGTVERWLARDRRLAAIDTVVGNDGRRIVLLMRLSPVFPFSALNYALGLTRLRLTDFLVAMAGIIPGTTLYVYSGTVAGAVAVAAAGNGPERGLASYSVLALGLVATLVVTVLITRAARRALKEAGAQPDANATA